MLKIREDVDLNALEKYGFKKNSNFPDGWAMVKTYKKGRYYQEDIYVWNDRKIQVNASFFCSFNSAAESKDGSDFSNLTMSGRTDMAFQFFFYTSGKCHRFASFSISLCSIRTPYSSVPLSLL